MADTPYKVKREDQVIDIRDVVQVIIRGLNLIVALLQKLQRGEKI